MQLSCPKCEELYEVDEYLCPACRAELIPREGEQRTSKAESRENTRLTRLVIIIFAMSIPIGLLSSYFLLPKFVEWTQSRELTVIVLFVPMLIGITSVLALIILRWQSQHPLPLFLYGVGGFGAPALYFGCFFITGLLAVTVSDGPTGGLEDYRNWVVIGSAWAITLLILMDFVLWVTRSRQS